jgi:DNA-binding CsgD family transcriptional regulator/tetratricopeptide (TPR) repeat protein
MADRRLALPHNGAFWRVGRDGARVRGGPGRLVGSRLCRWGLTGWLAGWWAGLVEGSGGFVGRRGELARFQGVLAGDARLLLVVGDAGVGKTRFVGEAMRRAAGGGVVSVWGGCLPLAEKLPLLPLVQALGELCGLEDGRLVEEALGETLPYVRAEVARLVPRLGPGAAEEGGPGGGWQRERLFCGIAELLGAVAARSPVGLVVEDVHWADGATLDCLTFLLQARGGGLVTAVATYRSDEVPLDEYVAGWLAHARGSGAVEEIRLGPLSRDEAAEQIAGLAGEPLSVGFADELYARAEGNPFFTEQLVAASRSGPEGDMLSPSAGLPTRLAELLAARAGACDGDAWGVLAVLAVAGRPLTEDMLRVISGLEAEAVRAGLRELATAQLLGDVTAGGSHRPRHALLAEAVAARLLPGERVILHERTAQALRAAGEQTLAAEAAAHWRAAARPAEELPARLAAAEAAEGVFGYAEAATHWQRAIELCRVLAGATGGDLPQLYVRAIDAMETSGDGEGARALAEEAYCQFADHPDPAIAAVIHDRAALFRGLDAPADGLPLIEEALRLFEQAPPSADQAEAWFDYALVFLYHGEGRLQASLPALNRALEIAEAVGATALIPRILSELAGHALLRGQVEEGFAVLDGGKALARAAGDGEAILWLAATESNAMLKMAEFESAAEVALQGLHSARQTGRQTSFDATVLISNAAEGLISRGHTSEAAALIDPLTAEPLDHDHWVVHEWRAEIDLLRGNIAAAASRRQQVDDLIGHSGGIDWACESVTRAAELALWSGRPAAALAEVRHVQALFQVPDLAILCGRLLAAGMRACADLAELARARQDDAGADAAVAAAGDLAAWVNQMAAAPFTDHPYMAAIPAERAAWDAERSRLAGTSDPAAWSTAAKAWDALGCPHRAAYAWWRHAEARLTAGQPPAAATAALQAAAAAADGHAPLLAEIRKLAERARILLPAPPATAAGTQRPAEAPASYGLTGRELAVLRLLAAGRTNAQIGAELFISPRTAGVHVTNILRKLGVSGRVQAASVAERAGLLSDREPST